MYETHFGLHTRPFAGALDPDGFVPLPEAVAVANRLRYGLEDGTGAALLVGPPGVGKTLLAHRLAAAIDCRPVWIDYPALPAAELLTYLADELAAPPAGGPGSGGMASALRRVRVALADAAAAGDRPLLVVDEAQSIDDPAGFEALRLLLNFAGPDGPDLRLLLLGTPDVLGRLPEPLADRLAATCALNPLTRSETAAYLQGRLVLAGWPPDAATLFDRDRVTTLHAAALGLPRRINRLADLALLVTFARGLDRPDADALAAAITESGLSPLDLRAA